MFLVFRPSLCSMVFSALAENNASLQITATSVLTLLVQQTGEMTTAGSRVRFSQKFSSVSNITAALCLSGLLLDSDIERAVDHLTRLVLTEEDDRVRSAHVEHLSLLESLWFLYHCLYLNTHTNIVHLQYCTNSQRKRKTENLVLAFFLLFLTKSESNVRILFCSWTKHKSCLCVFVLPLVLLWWSVLEP